MPGQAQPLNTDITIFRSIRSYRDTHRNETVAALIKHLRPLVMSIPGHEILAGVITRDTTVHDFSPYCGQASPTASRGFPVVFGLFDQVSFAEAQGSLTAVDFAFTIGQDKFLKSTTAGLTRDLHADARALTLDLDLGS